VSNAAFRSSLAAMVKKAQGNTELVVRGLALRTLRSLVMKSPVGDPVTWQHPAPPGYVGGQFRGNWFVQEVNAPVTTPEVDKDGGNTIAAGAIEIAHFHVGGKLYILNHLPYAQALEYGHSGQAPQGMVRITVEELETYLKEAAAEAVK
jgi:hypothetical protein